MSAFFIKHPVIATVIAVVTTLLGIVCLANLPVAQYPEITPRIIQLTAMFPGADAKAVADSVGTPLEREIYIFELIEKYHYYKDWYDNKKDSLVI